MDVNTIYIFGKAFGKDAKGTQRPTLYHAFDQAVSHIAAHRVLTERARCVSTALSDESFVGDDFPGDWTSIEFYRQLNYISGHSLCRVFRCTELHCAPNFASLLAR
jgi:hypothetical protein